MTAIRTGCDLASVDDVARAITEHGDRYLDRVFTTRERADAGDDPERLAARFAGKEAVVKLLRPARDESLPLHEIAIVLKPSGAPVVELSGSARTLAERVGITSIDVSLSHERGMALATAVALTRG
jgi:holo-[acyl-carrier protein] synthase